jgi:6-phosphofructokinase 1
MDNDLEETDYTFGFDSATAVALDAADRLRDTARSHRRIMVLEVMGRHAGWVALYTGIAAGADWILIPEVPVDFDEMCNHLIETRKRGKQHGLVVASEGAELPHGELEDMTVDAFGHVTLRERRVGEFVAKEIERRTEVETRAVTLGHVQRGGSPTLFDRVLATRVGLRAADLVHDGQFGMMAALKGGEIVAVPLADAVKGLKTVPVSLYEEVKTLFRR